jgi:hypothetical protein
MTGTMERWRHEGNPNSGTDPFSIHHTGAFGFAADSSKAIFNLILFSPTLPRAAGSGPAS